MSTQDVPTWLKISGAMVALIAPLIGAVIFIMMQISHVEASAQQHAETEISRLEARQSKELRRLEDRLRRIEDKLDRIIERGHSH